MNKVSSEILYTQEEIKERIGDLANDIMNENNDEIVFISLLNGSFMFSADLIRMIKNECKIDFMVVKSYKGTETTGKITIERDISLDIEGKTVIILDDIIDTGNTLFHIKQYIERKNPYIVKTCCLLNKQSRR